MNLDASKRVCHTTSPCNIAALFSGNILSRGVVMIFTDDRRFGIISLFCRLTLQNIPLHRNDLIPLRHPHAAALSPFPTFSMNVSNVAKGMNCTDSRRAVVSYYWLTA